jgi:hypothetical protein
VSKRILFEKTKPILWFTVPGSAFKAKRSDLKKQSQFAEGENEHKISHNKGLWQNSMFWQPMKTKPNKPNHI